VPAEWKLFFEPFHPDQAGWSTVETVPVEKYEKALAENQGLREMISQQESQLEELTKELSEKSRSVIAPDQNTPHPSHPPPAISPDYEDMVEPLRKMEVHKKPARFQAAFAEAESLYRRQLMLLYLMATKGVSIRIEMDLVMAVVEGIAPRASVVRKIVEKLVKGELLESEVLTLERPLHTSINLIRMTKDAKDFCHEMNWPVQESEWERLTRLRGGKDLHEKNVAIMLTTLHARIRGYWVKVLPEMNGEILSDLLLTDGDKNEYHTFVLLEDSIPHDVINKMKRVKGRVGICAIDPQNRKLLSSICKEHGIIQGVATDLQLVITGNREDQKPISIMEINKNSKMWDEEP
jgi:hypothetical protein